jgi:hypothetical protein
MINDRFWVAIVHVDYSRSQDSMSTGEREGMAHVRRYDNHAAVL